MKQFSIVLLVMVALLADGCGSRLQKFGNTSAVSAYAMDPANLYFIRICSQDTMVKEYEPSIQDTVESNLPLITYLDCATHQDAHLFDSSGQASLEPRANEELYLYLHGINNQLEQGMATFLIGEKFKSQSSKTYYYGDPTKLYLNRIKKIRLGSWKVSSVDFDGTKQLVLRFPDGKRRFILEAQLKTQGDPLLQITHMTNPSTDELSRGQASANRIAIDQVLGFGNGFPMHQAAPVREAVIKQKDTLISIPKIFLNRENERLYFLTDDNTGYPFKGKLYVIDLLEPKEQNALEKYPVKR